MGIRDQQGRVHHYDIEVDEYLHVYIAGTTKMIGCICGAVRHDSDWSEHYCPYDEHWEGGDNMETPGGAPPPETPQSDPDPGDGNDAGTDGDDAGDEE